VLSWQVFDSPLFLLSSAEATHFPLLFFEREDCVALEEDVRV